MSTLGIQESEVQPEQQQKKQEEREPRKRRGKWFLAINPGLFFILILVAGGFGLKKLYNIKFNYSFTLSENQNCGKAPCVPKPYIFTTNSSHFDTDASFIIKQEHLQENAPIASGMMTWSKTQAASIDNDGKTIRAKGSCEIGLVLSFDSDPLKDPNLIGLQEFGRHRQPLQVQEVPPYLIKFNQPYQLVDQSVSNGWDCLFRVDPDRTIWFGTAARDISYLQ